VLLFVDGPVGRVFRFDPDRESLSYRELRGSVGAIVPRFGGGLIVTLDGALGLTDGTGEDLRLLELDPALQVCGHLNDGKCDSRGRLWTGSVSIRNGGGGTLYRLDRDLRLAEVKKGFGMPNGLGWSPDGGQFYLVDSSRGCVIAYDFEPDSGAISGGRLVIALDPQLGLLDGLTVDVDGFLWVAVWGQSEVRKYDPFRGRVVGRVKVPASQVTSCGFGGAQLDQLFITTARDGCSHEPLAGDLFVVRDPGTIGLAPDLFGQVEERL